MTEYVCPMCEEYVTKAQLAEAQREIERTNDAYEASLRALHAAEAQVRALREALELARVAMRAPFDDWKGTLERKALDAAYAALATPPAPPEGTP